MPTQWMSHRAFKLILTTTIAAGAVSVPFMVATATAQPAAEKAAKGSSAVPDPVAHIGGEAVPRQALLDEAASSLAQIEQRRIRCETDADRNEQQALESAAERLVRKRLFALEAAKRGVTEDALREEVRVKASEVSDADVEDFFKKNQSQINQPLEKVAAQIKSYLSQQRLQKAEEDFFTSIRDGYEVDVLLEPLRVEVAADGPAKGPEQAPVTIIEFSDFECPYCKRVVPTLDQIDEKFGEQVRIVYRHYPLSIHPNAQKAAEASLCADDQGKFWEMHDLLFEEQQKLAVDDLKEKAARLELDAAAFGECLDSGRHAEKVKADFAAGSVAGVDGTPAFFVNGRFISGAVPFETIAPVIEDEIRRKQKAGSTGS
jgi:protein-disulfide isomerase